MGPLSFVLCRFRDEMSARPDFVDELLEIRAPLCDAIDLRGGRNLTIDGGESGKVRLRKHAPEEVICLSCLFKGVANGLSRRRLASPSRNLVHCLLVREQPSLHHTSCCQEVNRKGWLKP